MLDALLKGKVSSQVLNMEDVVVSSVFGLMRLLPAEVGLAPFLGAAVFSDDGSPLLASDACIEDVTYEFWPWIAAADCKGCEPDLLLRMRLSGGVKVLLGIEAKLWSGKSSIADDEIEAPIDQLAREWDNLTYAAEAEPNGGADARLLYITSDIAMPVDEILDSERKFSEKRKEKGRPNFRCAWVSWRNLIPLFRGVPTSLSNLALLADKLDLRYFHGISDPGIAAPLWRSERRWRFVIEGCALPLWHYDKQ